MNNFPNDFNPELYRFYYKDLVNLTNKELYCHYIDYGYKEGRIYKMPNDFDIKKYLELNHDLNNFNFIEGIIHYANHGVYENRKYKEVILLENNIFNRYDEFIDGVENRDIEKIFSIVVCHEKKDLSEFSDFNNNLIVYKNENSNISSLKDNINIKYVDNIGKECGIYCNYIIDNYNNLPEYVIFISEHIYNHNTKIENILNYIINEDKNYNFKYIFDDKEYINEEQLYNNKYGITITPIELGKQIYICNLIDDIKKLILINYPSETTTSYEIIKKLNDYDSDKIWLWEFNKLFINTSWYCTSNIAQRILCEINKKLFDYSKIKPLINKKDGLYYVKGSNFIVHKDNILKYPIDFWRRLMCYLQNPTLNTYEGCEKLWGFLFNI